MADPGTVASAVAAARAIKKKAEEATVQHFSLGSTAISDLWYKPGVPGFINPVLWVKFRKVKDYPKYRFEDVPMEVVTGMLNSRSAGQYYHDNIKGNFYSTDINGPEEGDAEIRELMFNLL